MFLEKLRKTLVKSFFVCYYTLNILNANSINEKRILNLVQRVSAYDVAKLAKVSQSTVSRVLNNYPYVKKDTREKVHSAIKELGFSPDEIARSLATNKTNTIGLIVEDLSNPFYAETAHIILREASKVDYEVIILDADSDVEQFDKSFKTLVGKRVDGVIVASIRKDNKQIHEYLKRNLPIILYNRVVTEIGNVNYIEVDNKKGAKMAIRHLVELKHRSIAYISGPTIYSTFSDRLDGYIEALEENNLEYNEKFIYKGDISYESVLRFSKEIMRQENPPTAFFASTDQIALAIMDAASQNGLHIPYDISVIGFDDINIAKNPFIGLTTISQQKEEMAPLALRKLINIIDSKKDFDEVDKNTLQPKLIVRKTTGTNNSQT